MPVFHFHICDAVTLPDEDGTELPDLNVARREAIHLAGAMLKEGADKIGSDWHLKVTDHTGLVRFRLDVAITEVPAMRPANDN